MTSNPPVGTFCQNVRVRLRCIMIPEFNESSQPRVPWKSSIGILPMPPGMTPKSLEDSFAFAAPFLRFSPVNEATFVNRRLFRRRHGLEAPCYLTMTFRPA